MKLPKLGATAALVAILVLLSCSKPAPTAKSYEAMIADEIRALEKLRAAKTAQYRAAGKSAAQIESMQKDIQGEIDKLKNPPPVPQPDDLPPAEPDKKG